MDHCHGHHHKTDWFYRITGVILVCSLAGFILNPYLPLPNPLAVFCHSTVALMQKMWWGVLLGIISVGFLTKVPREFVVSALGEGGGVKGLLRATLLGLFLDLCSHGILLVGIKLYERGASLGQMMAFLIASPWNSLSLTLILWSLIGLKYTLIFILLSALIAIVSGWIFDRLVGGGVLPANPNQVVIDKDFHFSKELKARWKNIKWGKKFFIDAIKDGFGESKMILRWLYLGIILAALLQSFVTEELMTQYLGPTLLGLGITMVVTTVIEVCSEGSTPIAADIFTRANAPGNSFAFLMAGVSTDYTEIMSIKEGTKSWKIALFLPLVTLPQVILLAIILNHY